MEIEKTQKGIRRCAEFLKCCLDLGWDKSDLDDLEALFWKFKDKNGDLKPKSSSTAAILSGEDWKEDGWVSVQDKPLVDWEERDGKKYWTETGAGARGFIAAVPYRDKTQPGKSLWWIHHCIIEETGLHIVGEDDNEPAGWNIEDVTHYVPIPSLMTISRTP